MVISTLCHCACDPTESLILHYLSFGQILIQHSLHCQSSFFGNRNNRYLHKWNYSQVELLDREGRINGKDSLKLLHWESREPFGVFIIYQMLSQLHVQMTEHLKHCIFWWLLHHHIPTSRSPGCSALCQAWSYVAHRWLAIDWAVFTCPAGNKSRPDAAEEFLPAKTEELSYSCHCLVPKTNFGTK